MSERLDWLVHEPREGEEGWYDKDDYEDEPPIEHAFPTLTQLCCREWMPKPKEDQQKIQEIRQSSYQRH